MPIKDTGNTEIIQLTHFTLCFVSALIRCAQNLNAYVQLSRHSVHSLFPVRLPFLDLCAFLLAVCATLPRHLSTFYTEDGMACRGVTCRRRSLSSVWSSFNGFLNHFSERDSAKNRAYFCSPFGLTIPQHYRLRKIIKSVKCR